MQSQALRLPSQLALLLAWLLALLATLVTLYGSEILKLPVCTLCWYQRACIYPLAIMLGIACYRNDLTVRYYALPLALLGAVFAFYQYLLQMIPGFAPIGLCSTGAECSDIHLNILGFITYPLLSLITCLLISLILLLARSR